MKAGKKYGGKPPGYFRQLIKKMVDSGFVLISYLQIDSKDSPYCGEAVYARSSCMFFHMVGKAFILKLTYHEDCIHEKLKMVGKWSIDFSATFRSLDNLWDLAQDGCLIPMLEEDLPVSGFELTHKEEPALYGIQRLGCHYEEREEMDLDGLAEELKRMAERISPYVRRHAKVKIKYFPPIEFFPTCQSVFWKKFRQGSFNYCYFESVFWYGSKKIFNPR